LILTHTLISTFIISLNHKSKNFKLSDYLPSPLAPLPEGEGDKKSKEKINYSPSPFGRGGRGERADPLLTSKSRLNSCFNTSTSGK
jgi:hypothetical protein